MFYITLSFNFYLYMYSIEKKSDVIVLMAHYNDNERIKKSILSIIEPFQVDILIVDDGSRIKPDENELQKIYTNGKINVLILDKNYGVQKVRNFGLKKISEMNYKYIAIQDSDDCNKENRFSKQINYLDENLDVMLLGSWCDYVDEKGNFLFTQKYPVKDSVIKKKMYLNSMFVHSTVIFRAEILNKIGFYPENYFNEDYAFLFNVAKNYKVENYPESLINYLVNQNGHTTSNQRKQVASRLKIILDNFYFGFYPIYGIVRNIPLLLFSRSFTNFIKKTINKTL